MPLFDFECEACGITRECYISPGTDDSKTCEGCGGGMYKHPYGAGTSRKTGVFPFVSTHMDGTGRPIVVESLGHLRTLEKTYGVMATAFSQNPNNQDANVQLPEFREGGRAYEGLRLPQHVAQQRDDRVRRAMRNMELRKYQGRPVVIRGGR